MELWMKKELGILPHNKNKTIAMSHPQREQRGQGSVNQLQDVKALGPHS